MNTTTTKGTTMESNHEMTIEMRDVRDGNENTLANRTSWQPFCSCGWNGHPSSDMPLARTDFDLHKIHGDVRDETAQRVVNIWETVTTEVEGLIYEPWIETLEQLITKAETAIDNLKAARTLADR